MVQSSRSRVLMKAGAVVLLLAIGVFLYTLMSGIEMESDSILGVKWESDINDNPEMKLLAQDGDLRFYARDSDTMRFYDVPVNRIVYGYYKGRFYNAMIYYGGSESFSEFKKMFSRHYGSPYQGNPSEKKYFWEMNDVNLFLAHDDTSNEGRVSYFFKPIADEKEAHEKRAKEARRPSDNHDPAGKDPQ